MSTDPNAGPPSTPQPQRKDSQAEIQLVDTSQRTKSQIASLNSQIEAVDEAIDTPAQGLGATPLPPAK